MAECSVSRCSHERRIFRRELQKWSKEILYILGLERLAEELMGAWKWKILVQPFTDLESKNPVDWHPEETCYFCCAKKQPPYDPASGIVPMIDNYSSLRIDTDEHSTSDQLKLSSSFISYSSALSPWGVPALSSSISNSSPTLDQPLDLSLGTAKPSALGGVSCSLDESQNSNALNKTSKESASLKSVLKVPQIPLKHGLRKRIDANSKRSYTEEELQAALRDIQSGKLGTRRAAVIYGIPRSTLRNKVYKLANESKSRAHCRVNQSTGNLPKKEEKKDIQTSTDIDVPVYNNLHIQNISSASESLRQLLKHTITQKVQGSSKSSEKTKNAFPMTDIDSMTELQMLGNLECSQGLAPVLSHVFSNIQNLALVKSKENLHCSNHSLNALNEDMKLPLLPNLIRRLAEERIELEKDLHKDSVDIKGDESIDMSSTCNQSNVILKVPSFKPAKSSSLSSDLENPSLPALCPSSPPLQVSSHSFSGNKGIAVSLKELIARSLSQRVASNQKEETSLEYPFCTSNTESEAIVSPWVTENVHKEEKVNCLNNTNNSSNSSDSIKSKKRTRPKRGRYRNYDRDNLARAVRAVQKGEMSVHRAGTFYGVPHSTLEYKVKERHLLRPKKREIFSNSLLSDTSEPVSALKRNQALTVENNISLKNLKNNLNSFDTSSETELSHRPVMDSYPSPLSIWQSLPFLSLDLAQFGGPDNFFASQMMRKLQENARIQEETQMKQSKDNFGILETLIKSTLEKSVVSDNKSSIIFASDSANTLSDSIATENVDK